MRSLRIVAVPLLLALAVLKVPPASAHEEQVILVGRSAAGELRVDADFAQPVELPPSVFPGIPGYATGELALHSTIVDDPTNDFFQLSVSTDFRFILLAKDPGIEVWNGVGYMATNEMYVVGPSPFDVHPIWNIVTGTPGDTYSLTLKLRDQNGVYPDSAPFVLSFTPMQVPSEYKITIRQVDPLHATISWTTNAAGWELQSTASASAANWNTVTNVPGVAGTNYFLNITIAGAQCFYRLKK